MLLVCVALQGQEVRIGVLGLFHPKTLRVTVGGSEVELRAGAGEWSSAGPVTVELPGKIRRRYEGRFEVKSVRGELRPVVVIDLERAASIAAFAEAPDAHTEARKAQIVLARSYYVAERRRHVDVDFCDTTHCQLFQDVPPTGLEQQRGWVLTYRGKRFAPMYFRSCGGTTTTAESVGLAADPYPYFRVSCEACTRNPERWSSRLPASAANALVQDGPSEKLRLELGRRFGWSALPSNTYRTVVDGEHVKFEGVGHGHGVGVCQRGAEDLARRGYDFRAILLKYLPGSAIVR